MQKLNSPQILVFSTLISALIISTILFLGWSAETNSKIAFIRSADLVDEYMGMREMRIHFQDQKIIWEAQIDSLKANYVAEGKAAAAKLNKLAESEKQVLRRDQYLKEQNLKQQIDAIKYKMNEKENELTQAVLDQVNSFIQQYANQHSIELVFGTTRSGNILYGEEYLDITDDVSKKLNEYYLKGEE